MCGYPSQPEPVKIPDHVPDEWVEETERELVPA
jgi:hypothetical protein